MITWTIYEIEKREDLLGWKVVRTFDVEDHARNWLKCNAYPGGDFQIVRSTREVVVEW